MDKELIKSEWMKINVELNNLIDELEELDKEREDILSSDKPEEEAKEEMENSITKYQILLEKMKALREKSDSLRKMMEE